MTATKVDLEYVGESPGRPPLVNLYVDVTLDNAAPTARWFVLPVKATVGRVPPGKGVAGVAPYRMTGAHGTVILARFLGTAGFQTVLVPAGGRVTLRRLTIQLWDEHRPVAPIPIEVVVASAIDIGDEPVTAWIPIAPTSDNGADVSRAEPLRARDTPDMREVAARFSDAQVVAAELRLPRQPRIMQRP